MSAEIFTWDWKAQPDLDRIAAAVREISGGRVWMQAMDTGGDNYAWTVADHELTGDEQWQLYMS